MGNVTDGGSGLFDTIVRLVNVGFAGVGVVVLLLVFIILFQGKPADDGARRLHNRFLTLGMAFAFFCGILSVAAPGLSELRRKDDGATATKSTGGFNNVRDCVRWCGNHHCVDRIAYVIERRHTGNAMHLFAFGVHTHEATSEASFQKIGDGSVAIRALAVCGSDNRN